MTTIPGTGWSRWLSVVVTAAVVVSSGAALGAGCSAGGISAAPNRPRLNVVASLFPLAEVARRVGGDRVTVIDLTPSGVEPRGLAISPLQVDQIRSADVVLDVGLGFQPAVEEVAAAADRRTDTLAVLPAIGGSEPHVWLDPIAMEQVVALVAQAFQRADPAGRATYDRGARDFTAALGALDISYRSSLADCAGHELVTSNAAFARMGARYGLNEDPIAGGSGAASDPAGRLAVLANLIRAKHVKAVFTEPLASPSAAELLARQAHVKTEALDPIEGLTGSSPPHATYLSLMADDLATLLSALGCANSEG
jgi:zinc transport system substrate-binding protein